MKRKKSIFIRRLLPVVLLVFITAACSTPGKFIVTELGYAPPEKVESFIYVLPQTIIKVKVDYKKEVFIPGPYADYAMKLLGISDVQKERTVNFRITNSELESHLIPDQSHYYSVNVTEGNFDTGKLEKLASQGFILLNNESIMNGVAQSEKSTGIPYPVYRDVTMESNTEIRTETIYKTVLTDTSFIKVPVTSEQMERKTLEKKAEEAARLILELRSDRYYLSAGLLDPYPANFQLDQSMKSLDRLEEEYLSLFIGKRYEIQYSKEYLLAPEGDSKLESLELDYFSTGKGMGDREGSALKLNIESGNHMESYRTLLPQIPENEAWNQIYYRIPAICTLKLEYEEQVLYKGFQSIMQAGALVNTVLSMD